MAEKRTTKKAAAKVEAPEPEVQPEVQPEPPRRTGPGWPFDNDHYLSTPVASRRGHSDGPSVRVVQQALGVEVTGAFDEITAAAVGDWQREHERPVTKVVDRDTWDELIG